MSEFKEYTCPFCEEGEFDLFGLQFHLERRECKWFGYIDKHNQKV